MSTDMRDERLARRITVLHAQQFAGARPREAVTAAIEQPGLRLRQLVRTVTEAYAERPAVGQRAVQLVNNPKTGRTSLELLPRFETVTYRELWDRAGAIAAGLTNDPLLIYTSGSTGAPKAVMHPERLVANFWRRSTGAALGQHRTEPSITLSFIPMSHAMGRPILYGALGDGGTAYVAAKSDLSTLFEDLPLVRPIALPGLRFASSLNRHISGTPGESHSLAT